MKNGQTVFVNSFRTSAKQFVQQFNHIGSSIIHQKCSQSPKVFLIAKSVLFHIRICLVLVYIYIYID